jgi:hypothetical protein
VAAVSWSDDLIMMVASPWAVLSGWHEEKVLYPGKEHFVLYVKCVSEINAMSILLSFKDVIILFRCLIRPLAFQRRMVRDWKVNVLLNILSEKTIEDSGEEI